MKSKREVAFCKQKLTYYCYINENPPKLYVRLDLVFCIHTDYASKQRKERDIPECRRGSANAPIITKEDSLFIDNIKDVEVGPCNGCQSWTLFTVSLTLMLCYLTLWCTLPSCHTETRATWLGQYHGGSSRWAAAVPRPIQLPWPGSPAAAVEGSSRVAQVVDQFAQKLIHLHPLNCEPTTAETLWGP